jgi:predicted permease
VTIFARFRSWLRVARHRSAFERDMRDEFLTHIAHRADDLERQGLSPAAAERTARVEFGSIDAYEEAGREARGLGIADEARANIGYAVRSVRRRPLLSLVVIITLTLGIGISTGVFTVLDAVALRPRVDGDSRTFVRVFSAYGTDSTPPGFPGATNVSDYLAFRDGARSLRALAGWQNMAATVDESSTPTRGLLVTCEFFDVYALSHLLIGRLLRADDCLAHAAVAILSEQLWRDRFSAATDVVGRALQLNGRPVQIVGVAPASFSGQMNGAELWVPYTARAYLGIGSDAPNAPDALRLNLDGRMRAGYLRSDVREEIRVVAAQQDRLHRGRRTVTFTTNGSLVAKPGNGRVAVLLIGLMLSALACLVVVACGNVVSLLLALAHVRQREMAIRMALGSGSARLARMLFTETLLLAGVAGVAALYVAYRTPSLLLPWLTQRPLTFPVRPDWIVFAFLAAVTLLAGIATASAPVRASLNLDLVGALTGLPKQTRRAGTRAGRILVGTQTGAALVLLIGGATLVRLPVRVSSASPHIETTQVMDLNLLVPGRAEDRDGWRRYHDEVTLALRDVSGVRAIAFGSAVPVGDERVDAIALTPANQSPREMSTIQVSPDYFRAFGIQRLRGRAFTVADEGCASAVCPVIVSRAVARELWPQTEPLGQRLEVSRSVTFEIVGVVGDATSDVADAADALMIYRPWSPNAHRYRAFVRFEGTADQAARAVAAAVRRRFPEAIVAPQTIQAGIDQLMAGFGRLGLVVGGVAIIAAILALVGVYGVVSLTVKRRTKEMGIRVALGARNSDVYRAILGSSAPPVLVGLAAGLTLAAGAAAVIDRAAVASLPAHVTDPLAFFGAALVLAGVALAAIMWPARQAGRVDPVDVLRQD